MLPSITESIHDTKLSDNRLHARFSDAALDTTSFAQVPVPLFQLRYNTTFVLALTAERMLQILLRMGNKDKMSPLCPHATPKTARSPVPDDFLSTARMS